VTHGVAIHHTLLATPHGPTATTKLSLSLSLCLSLSVRAGSIQLTSNAAYNSRTSSARHTARARRRVTIRNWFLCKVGRPSFTRRCMLTARKLDSKRRRRRRRRRHTDHSLTTDHAGPTRSTSVLLSLHCSLESLTLHVRTQNALDFCRWKA